MSQRKFAIVTGASSGIGLELAKLAAQDGYDLLLAADTPFENLGELQGHGGEVRTVEGDLASFEGVDRLVEAAAGRPVDALFANAGHGLGRAFLDQDPAEWRHVIDTNIVGTVYLIQKVARQMVARNSGRILITGSIAGHIAGAFQAVYNGSKAFVDSFSDALNNELKDTGVTVTCLKPGPTETEFFERADMEDTKVGAAKKDDPAAVAKTGYDAMMSGERSVVYGLMNKLQVAGAKVLGGGVSAEMHRKQAEPGTASLNPAGTLLASKRLSGATPVAAVQTSLKRLLANRVRAVFSDDAGGQRRAPRGGTGLFGPNSVAGRVHGDVTTMMVGGMSALLLQMLHPAVLAGVWDHSNFREDMHGRLRRTARFIGVTTYGSRDEAEAAVAKVRHIHSQVRGATPDGTTYSAQDSDLLAWVHATETISFLDAWMRYAEPAMPAAEQDRYFRELALVARALGATAVPTSRAETVDYINSMRPRLRSDRRTREVAQLLLEHSSVTLDAVPLQLIRQAAVDLLPAWARQMHRLRASGLSRPMVQGGTLFMARTLRWALQ